MAQYGNLKDYFQCEHLDLIKASISEYCSKHQYTGEAEDVQVQKLRCTFKQEIPDTSSDLEIDAGVSVQFVDRDDNSNSAERFFLIHISGDLRLKLGDIEVSVIKEIDESEMPEESIYNQFLLPTINADDIERLFKEFYHLISDDKDIKSVQPLTFITFLKDLQLPIYFADLDDTCLGRLNLAESDIDIYLFDEIKNDLVLYSKKAIYGTVILNRKKYYEEKDGELLITLSHELVHWVFHQKFFRILVLLGNDDESLNCKAQLPIFNNNLNDSQKALCIAEWQANELSWRIVMPEVGVKYWIEKINEINSIKNSPTCFSYELIVVDIAYVYKVSPYVAKKRLRQLGYDYVDGTFLEYEENGIKINPAPFYFAPDTLKENETFVIYRNNYERLLRENEDFAELINSGRYVYLGYVVCLQDAKYIAVESVGNDIRCVLSEYARENAHKCLLKFRFRNEKASNQLYHYNAFYLNKMPDYNEIVPESFDLCEDDTELDSKTIMQISEYNENMNRLNSPDLSTFANTVVYHMHNKEIDDKELKKRIGLSISAIEKIYNGITKNVDVRNVMALCIGLELDSEECYDMFKKAGHNVHEDTMQNRAYRFLFSCTQSGLKECNKILRYFNQDELPYHRRK